MLDLQDAQVRPGVRDAVNGRVRGQDEGQHVEVLKRKAAAMGFQLSPAGQKVSRLRRSPSRDTPLAMHNDENPEPPVSVHDSGVRGYYVLRPPPPLFFFFFFFFFV